MSQPPHPPSDRPSAHQYPPSPYAAHNAPEQWGAAQGAYAAGYGYYAGGPGPNPQGPVAPDGRPLAGFGERVGAYILDRVVIVVGGLLAGGLVVGIFMGLTALGPGLPSGSEDPPPLFVAGILLGLLVASLFGIVYRTYYHSRSGRTLGKRLCGVRLVSWTSCTPPGAGRAFLRELLLGVLGFSFIGFILSALWPLWDDRNRTIHDIAVDTVVVKG